MLDSERGDVDGYPEPSTKDGVESTPKVKAPEPAHRTRSKSRASRASTVEPCRSIPRYLRALAIGPVSTGDLFKPEVQHPHKYPLLLVRNERMAEYYGPQWYDRAKQSQSILSAAVDDGSSKPSYRIPDDFFTNGVLSSNDTV